MLLIKNGRVIDPSSKTDEILDILIDDEKIIKMDKNISALNSDMKIIDAADLVVVPGLIDVHSHFRDPGFTYKEDILSGSRAAARGGYTTVVCMANTNPVVDNEETLNYILDKAKDSKIEILQVASVTKGLNGTKLVNME
ncbi:MAG TPA: dihydroorotase, partial [Clostridiaceae bacterium]|nr:dihydroorotase [Clostridiaceae bacterium]